MSFCPQAQSELVKDSAFSAALLLSRPKETPLIQTNTPFGAVNGSKIPECGIQEVIMWLNESEQELRRDLQGLASDLRWSAVELLRIEQQLRQDGNEIDAQAVQKLCALFQGDEAKLSGYAEEVKAKVISRNKAQ
ncbi:hypothetical protein J3D47_002632 [Pseudomonas laurylsulfativorans]|nr:hypothetical protein [Pseudomonas laurylsulfativorans]